MFKRANAIEATNLGSQFVGFSRRASPYDCSTIALRLGFYVLLYSKNIPGYQLDGCCVGPEARFEPSVFQKFSESASQQSTTRSKHRPDPLLWHFVLKNPPTHPENLRFSSDLSCCNKSSVNKQGYTL